MGIEKKVLNVETILKNSNVRPSPARILVLKILLESSRPLSALEIENQLETLDRSSITRTLPVLLEAHLIHQLSDGSGSMKYEACKDVKFSDKHNDEHAHFHCVKCGETTCLNDMEIKIPQRPEGYVVENISFIISGHCPKCSEF